MFKGTHRPALLPVLMLAAIILTAGVSTPANAGTYLVNSTADTTDGTCDGASCTLREAVSAANANAGDDTIAFDETVFDSAKTITLGSSLPAFTGNVAVTGPTARVTLDGINKTNYLTAAFTVHEGVVAGINNLTVTNCRYAIFNYGTTTVVGCEMTNNYIAVYNDYSYHETSVFNYATVTVTNSTWSNNTIALYNMGTATVTTCVFTTNVTGMDNNTTNEGFDRPLHLGSLAVTDTTLSGNSSAIGNDGLASVTNCILDNNTEGFYNEDTATATITNSTLNNNSNKGFSNYGIATVTGCDISNNRAGMYCGSTSMDTFASITNIINSTLSNDQDGIWNEERLNLTGCTMNGNPYGLHNMGTANVVNSTLASNSTAIENFGFGSSVATISITNSTLSSNLRGIYNDGVANLKNSIVVGNSTYNIRSSFTDGGNNITSGTAAEAGLETSDGLNAVVLKDNGGPTKTIAIKTAGTALNGGNNAIAKDADGNDLTTDQRGAGFPRIQGGTVDIGAFEATTFSISGRVIDSSGAGIANASILRGAGSTPVLTDSNGNYTLTGVIAGTYTLSPGKSGYGFSPATRNVTLTNANVANQNFTGYTTALSGRVAFSNGTGIGNVQVRLGTGRSVLTNGAGYYTFFGIAPGAYTVTPVLGGYSFDPAYRQVTVGTSTISGFNFIGGYTITGRLYTSSGIGITNQSVSLSGRSTPVM